MPLTPLHLIAGIGVKAVQPKLDFTTFTLVNIAIDIEPALMMLTELGYENPPLHGVLAHNFLSATVIACLIALSFRKRNYVWFSALFGAWSHIMLDMFYHGDMHPFWPFSRFQFTTTSCIDWFCVLFGTTLAIFAWYKCQSVSDIRRLWNCES